MRHMDKLERLVIDSKAIKNIDVHGLHQLPKLQYMAINVVAHYFELGNLANLSHLDVLYLHDLDHMDNKLIFLSLSPNIQIINFETLYWDRVDLSHMARLTMLTELYMNKVKLFHSDLHIFGTLTSLQKLSLKSVLGLKQSSLQELVRHIPRLTNLNLDRCFFNDRIPLESLTRLPYIETLDLEDDGFTNVHSLTSLCNLTHMTISHIEDMTSFCMNSLSQDIRVYTSNKCYTKTNNVVTEFDHMLNTLSTCKKCVYTPPEL